MENYIWYLENVLGLKNPIWPQRPQEAVPQAQQQPARSQILFIDETPWSNAATELFQKMREAMKLSSDQISICFASQVSTSQLQVSALAADRVVCFSKKIFESLSIEANNKFSTFSPEELLKQPTLKRQTWNDLQQVMKSLGLI
jgi:hypothetical protein